jgi:hypothetical protein
MQTLPTTMSPFRIFHDPSLINQESEKLKEKNPPLIKEMSFLS